MNGLELWKVIFLGIIEGITEWLPISSTGHMILADEFLQMNVTPEFLDVFFVLIQLGAIMAVVFLYFPRLMPFSFQNGIHPDPAKWSMWYKILIASIPAGVVGILWDDVFTRLFYNDFTVAVMLILFGILFLIIEKRNQNTVSAVNSIGEIGIKTAFWIGIFQMIAAVFPGTSRSGATIVGALLLGVSRSTATEFTFFLAIPAMFGGSLIKLLKFHGSFTESEIATLIIGMGTAFLVSIAAIRFLTEYIKNHDFKIFGWYRIALGMLMLGRFFV
ncbi:MAG: undecaprenyl-diphosphate phosphatase [Lachnospiraceae bacterium]